MTSPNPEFATNRPGERVADALNDHLAHLRTTLADPPELAIATAYFNPGGHALLADELDHPKRVRLLLGAEPEIPERRVRALRESPTSARCRVMAAWQHGVAVRGSTLGGTGHPTTEGKRP